MHENADYKSTGANDLSRFIKVYDDVLTADDCELLRREYDACKNKYVGQVMTENGMAEMLDVKHVIQAKIEYDSATDNLVNIAVGKVLQEYINNYEFYPTTTAYTDSGYFIRKYEIGVDFYDWHTDNCSLETTTRVLAMLFYLNDVEEGGETEFDIGIAVQPKQGRVLVFPAGFQYPHRAVTPVSEPKYLINTFIGYDRNKEDTE